MHIATSAFHNSPIRAAAALTVLLLVLVACGGDETNGDEIDGDTSGAPTEAAADPAETAPSETPTPQPEASPTAAGEPTEEPKPTATPSPESEPEPEEDVDLAPELAGLTDWRNSEPVTLEDLRGEPVVLVFWNSI